MQKGTSISILATIIILLSLVGSADIASSQGSTESKYLPVISKQTQEDPDGWTTLAANYQRTSWSPEEVRGELTADWYRVIEPFIPHKIQVIAADDKVFVSTASGLYAFDAEDGGHEWTYATELPLGHSPTYSNGYLYVGGYDRRIYAINASSGTLKNGWNFVEAGAGFETNPVVVNNRVYAGNRDGYFYCFDAETGELIWRWRDGSDEFPDAPIRQSAAYKDGVFYFGSDNSHVYALRDAGTSATLVWKSEQLPGVGFSTYWPVIYTEPATGRDYVLLSGTKKEVGWVWFGESYFDENYEIFSGVPVGGLIGPTGTVPGDWTPGTRTIDASSIQQFLNSKPHKRHLFILEADSGDEHSVLPPVTWVSATHGGNKHPPVIGSDGVIYTHIGYQNGNPGEPPNGGASGCISGWKFGTEYISQVCEFSRGFADEPVIFTAGGDLIYWVEGFNMPYGAFEITQPLGSNASWTYPALGGWNNGQQIAPNTHEMYEPCWVFGGCNGVYQGEDKGFYPYKGRLYMFDNNALVALSPTGNVEQLSNIQTESPENPPITPLSPSHVNQRLEEEITKIIQAGHLRPGFHDSGLWGQSASGSYWPLVEGDHLAEYFHNPGDTVVTLASALPYLSSNLQNQVRSYIQNFYGPGDPYDLTEIVHIGWKDGAQREIFTDTPERAQLMSRDYDDPASNIATVPRDYTQITGEIDIWDFPPMSIYAAWKYAQVFPSEATTIFDNVEDKLEPANRLSNAQLIKYPYLLNAYIAGYRGYMELEVMAGIISSINQSNRWADYNQLLNLRLDNFSKDTFIQSDEFTYEKTLNVSRNFIYLVPELGEELGNNLPSQVQAAISEYNELEPYWFVSKFDQTYGEGVYQPLYDYHALFQAKAYILNESYEDLVRYLDAPAFHRGDLFYINNLVAALSSQNNIQLFDQHHCKR